MIDGILRLSLRIRLSIAFALAILPFAALFMYADLYYYRPLVDEFALLAERMETHFSSVNRLQLALSRAAMPPNDYLIHGGREERQRFTNAVKEVDAAFSALADAIRNAHPFEADKLASLQQRWSVASDLGLTILNWPRAERQNEAAVETMQFFDAEIEHLARESDLLLAHVRSDLRKIRLRAVERQESLARAVGIAALFASLISLALIVYVSRTLLKPFGTHTAGTQPMPKVGGPGHRFGVRRTDEPGRLATTVNEIAKRLGARERDLLNVGAHDTLTGLWNRGYFERQLDFEIEQSLNDGTPLSLMMLDLDQFKQVNNIHGRDAGDIVLKTVADRIRHAIRHSDIAARHGGEEYALLMPGTSPTEAAIVAERIRAQIAEPPINIPGASISITVSIGVSGDRPNQLQYGYGPSLLARAEQALFRAKQEGRNRVVRID